MDNKAGPSRPKRACINEMKKPLSDEQLAELHEMDLSDDDLDFLPSESEYCPSDSSSESENEQFQPLVFDSISVVGPDTGVEQLGQLKPQTDNISHIVSEKWSSTAVPPDEMKNLNFERTREMLVPIPGSKPVDFFRLLFDEEFQNLIVQETNAYAILVLFSSSSEQSRIANWKTLTVEEFQVFIGLLLHMGTIQLPKLQDYWKTDRLFNIPIFREQMSRNRFLLILRCLHFSSQSEGEKSQDALQKIRPAIKYFNEKMTSIYYPYKELSLDESMMLWRGRLAFRQYIKNKRHKYGIKLYMLTEPDGTVLRFHVYTGSSDSELSGTGHASKVVMSLMESKLNKGHSLYG